MSPYGYKFCLYDTDNHWHKTTTGIKNTLRAYKKKGRNEGKKEARKGREAYQNDR